MGAFLVFPLLVPLQGWAQPTWNSGSITGASSYLSNAPVLINKQSANSALPNLVADGSLGSTTINQSPTIGLLTNGYLGFLGTGIFGGLDDESRWTVIGDRFRFNVKETQEGDKSSGLRQQWGNNSALFGTISRFGNTNRPLPEKVYDGIIEWSDNRVVNGFDPAELTVKKSQEDVGNFRFVFTTSPPSMMNPIPSIKNEVMTLTPKGQVGIANPEPFGKLDVRQLNDAEINVGIYSEIKNEKYRNRLDRTTVAVQGTNQSNFLEDEGIAVGVQGFVAEDKGKPFNNSSQINIGVRGSAYDTKRCYGVYGQVNQYDASDFNPGDSRNPFPSGLWGVFSNGDIGATGAEYFSSDQRLKTKVETIYRATDLLASLSPKRYFFKKDKELGALGLDTKRQQYGLIAQDVEKVLPELVKQHDQFAVTSPDGKTVYPEVSYKMVNYNAFIPILIAGFQEQQILISSLNRKIDSLANVANKTNYSGRLDVKSGLQKGVGTAILFPNPNDGRFSIRINGLEKEQASEIYVTNLAGAIVYKAAEVKDGDLMIDLSKSSKGIYQYTLFTNKQEVVSNKFVVE